MAGKEGRANSSRNKRAKLPDYFFLDEQLHKRLHINRGKDRIKTWHFKDACIKTYVYSDVLRRFKRTFSTEEVAEMVYRRRLVIDKALRDGMIESPQRNYSLDESRKPLSYRWQEKDIMGLLDYLSTVHRGRPRKDGEIIPAYLPTPRELRARIRGEGEVLYVKSDDGDSFIPTWRAKEW